MKYLVLALVASAIAAAHVSRGTVENGVLQPARRILDWAPAIQALPPELVLPRSVSKLRLVSLVAADLDADGDLDIVASDGSLDLIVWVNDGTGHLRRKQPVSRNAWQPVPVSPSLSDHQATASPSIQNDDAPADVIIVASRFVRIAASLGDRQTLPLVSFSGSRLRSRAPPAASFVTSWA